MPLEEFEKGEHWTKVWTDLITCGKCRGLITDFDTCPICGHKNRSKEHTYTDPRGAVHTIHPSYAGGVDWTTYGFITLMQREWERPTLEERPNSILAGIPQRFMVVLLFWLLFENLMGRLLSDGLAVRKVQESISHDLLKRYTSIGSRMDRLYKLVFQTSIKDDLIIVGYPDVHEHLKLVQSKRNDFMHGSHEAITEQVVFDTVSFFKDTQKAWIKLYNLHCTLTS